ncbi:MAG: hypothetical protein KatS3mg042_1392 [Rhodothermaceae bacterium]|nr:MAG: hypothetical protein KatS3mg042_1392 [Rhodothermaceae bacterium]
MYATRRLLFVACFGLMALAAHAQENAIPPDLRGQESWIARGILDGNLIETNFRNHGELSRWNDLPWGIWPRGIGGRHIDGIGIMVAGQVPGERLKWPQFYPNATSDTTLNPVILTYRDAGKRLGPSGELWGWLPLPGFHNENRIDPITGQRNPVPALSNDPSSWPAFWPDRLNNPDDPGWPGRWNGFFGKGVFNADLESFYVMDDLSDMEYAIDPLTGQPNSEFGIYYPDPADSTRGGMGLQNQVRIFQWANVLAEDVMFILYRVNNIGQSDHRALYFAQIMDYGLGQEEGDENAAFNPQQDVAYGWDQDGIGTRPGGGTYELGYTGFAFLESPARPTNGLDDDEDGIIDESRFSGAGSLIEGADAIRTTAAGLYDLANFEAFYGPLDERPAVKAGRWWTGDENLDWVGFTDENGNGVWDQGEPVNNDVGRDGLGPFDLGYPGPDDGEVDGIPTPGEPNFDELDIDESDQVGLTGFDLQTRPFYESGDNLRDDTWLWDRIINFAQFPLGTKPEAFKADIEPFLLFTSGPVALPPGAVNFFSTAWIFGEDEDDFFKNRRTVQNIFNADYNFAQPPFLPKLTAVPGDGRVVLSWDTTAVASFDRFTQEFDFEGFKLYKGTDPLLSDARLVTNVDGTPTFFKPIAQWDLDNGIRGAIPVFGGEAVYNLGDDTGLQFFYVDEDVTNGITYYYALVAYDRGFRDPNDPTKEPIDPQENVFNINVTQAGRVTSVSRNAAVVVPRALPVGYVEGGANEDLSHVTEGIGTGSIDVQLLLEEEADFDAVYRINFFSEPVSAVADLYTTTGYEVVNVSTGETLIARTPLVDVTPPAEGFAIEIRNDDVAPIEERTGYVANVGTPNEVFSLDPRTLDGYTTNWVARVFEDTTGAFVRSPYDYELRWVSPDDSLYTPPRFFGFLREAIPVFAVNTTLNTLADLLIEDRNDNGTFDAGDDLIINERPGGVGTRRFRYRIRFTAADGNSVPPSPGNVLRISVTRPFATGDSFQFTLRPPEIDTEQARNELDRIAVVPNPYVGTNAFEPRSQIEGRGERRVQFIHLPPRCTIRIFNLRGELVRRIEHDSVISDGAAWWDLRTEEQQDVAAGVYIFHVEAPGIGEHIGKFALIK